MKYEDALQSSLESCWSYVYHKYPILPMIISYAITSKGCSFGLSPFKITRNYKEGYLNVKYIGEGIIDLCREGSLKSDLRYSNNKTFHLPTRFACACPIFEPTVVASVIRGYEQRTKDAIKLYDEIVAASGKFVRNVATVSKIGLLDIRILLAATTKVLHDDGRFDLSENASDTRSFFGMSPSEYIETLTLANATFMEKLYEPLHLIDPDAIYYLFRDIDGFCKEYEMSATYREVLTLYIKCFKPVYEKIYAHVMHYGNEKFMRWSDTDGNISNVIHALHDNPNKKSAKISMTDDESNGKGFIGSRAVEMNQGPCSLGMSNIYIMTRKGMNDNA